MTSPSAAVVADSINPDGQRVTTVQATMHRFVLAELNTHRVFSRNSASSRAIPVARQIACVVEDPAVPVEFGAKRAGMQAGPALEGEDHQRALAAWLGARDAAVDAAKSLVVLGVHKQVTNRLLEPFMWHTVIVTATEWDGFWAQRCSPLAQPEIRLAAEAMKEAVDASIPLEVDLGNWHLPYIAEVDRTEVNDDETLRRVSAARCGRVSYLNHEGRRDLDDDLRLYDKFIGARPAHASPLEHVATPARSCDRTAGNLQGWTQLRHLVLT
jgi:Thymidylate synthase complementing protein